MDNTEKQFYGSIASDLFDKYSEHDLAGSLSELFRVREAANE